MYEVKWFKIDNMIHQLTYIKVLVTNDATHPKSQSSVDGKQFKLEVTGNL